MGPSERIEDTVIILDASRSMMRTDFEPSRIEVAFEIIKLFIQTKFSLDPKDRISLLIAGEAPKRLVSFTHDEDQLINSLEKIEIKGKSTLHEALSFAIQMLIAEMRKVGGKLFRIFIISATNSLEFSEDLKKIVKIAQGLGIFIDTCKFGKINNNNKTTFKQMAMLTDGEFGFFNNNKAIINAGKSFASKKTIKQPNEFYSQVKKDRTPLLNEVALSLRRPSLGEIQLLMSGKITENQKCAICYSIKAPLTGADFFSEGRTCPSCERTMHISCAAQWAKKSEFKENVFRCPFCFFLLKVPQSALSLFEVNKMSSKRVKIIEDEKTTEMIQVPVQEISAIEASCSYCRNIFSNTDKVFTCQKCNSYYHEHCLDKMITQIQACRYCGSQIIS